MTAEKRLLATALLVASAALYSPAAPAQNTKAVAESLFQAAKQLMADKKYAEACPKFAESQKLDPAPGTLLNLARCYEGMGKTASAWAEYKAAAALAGRLGQKDREDGARELADKLEPRLSKHTITAAPTPGLVVKSDGVEIGSAIFGTPLSVDPGEHLIEASAPGHQPWSTKVVIGANADSKTTRIPALVKASETTPLPTTTATAPPSETATTTAPTPSATPAPTSSSDAPPPGASNSMRTASYVLMGAGLVGIGVGAVFGGLAASDIGNATSDPALCPDKVCTPAGRAVVDDASTKALISTIALPVGLVAAGAGVVLFLVSSPKSPQKGALPVRKVAVTPVIGPGGASVSIRGAF